MGCENSQEDGKPLTIRIRLSKARHWSEVADTKNSTGEDAARRRNGE